MIVVGAGAIGASAALHLKPSSLKAKYCVAAFSRLSAAGQRRDNGQQDGHLDAHGPGEVTETF